ARRFLAFEARGVGFRSELGVPDAHDRIRAEPDADTGPTKCGERRRAVSMRPVGAGTVRHSHACFPENVDVPRVHLNTVDGETVARGQDAKAREVFDRRAMVRPYGNAAGEECFGKRPRAVPDELALLA